MIAAEYDRQLARVHHVLHLDGQRLACGAELKQVLRLLLRRRSRLRPVDPHVAEVAYFIVELRDALIEERDPQRVRAQVIDLPADTEIERHIVAYQATE